MNTDFTKQASRYACAILHGLPKNRELVGAHNCGNGHDGCVNPYHLRWATNEENAVDRIMHALQRTLYGKTAGNADGPLMLNGVERPQLKRQKPAKRKPTVRVIATADDPSATFTQPAKLTAVEKQREQLAKAYLSERTGLPVPLAIVDPELFYRLHPQFPRAASYGINSAS